MSQRTSCPDAISNSALHHWLAERVFDWSGTPVAHLQPTAFNEWLLVMRNMIKDNRYAVPFGVEGTFAPVSAEDQGAVIAAILAEPSGHAGKTYRLSGPTDLTPPEIADVVSKVLGRKICYEKISGSQWVKEVTGQDIPYLNQHIEGIAEMHPRGLMAGTTNWIENITGRKPESVADFVEKHRAVWEDDTERPETVRNW